MAKCNTCGCDYNLAERRNKPGKIIDCDACADEVGDVTQYTGVPIYGHKTVGELQINADPTLTSYIRNATALRNKGSNLGNNLKASSARKVRTEGACVFTVSTPDYKGRQE